MELEGYLDTTKKVIMLCRLLTECPSYAVRMSALQDIVAKKDVVPRYSYTFLVKLRDLGYIENVSEHGVKLVRVVKKKLLKDFEDLTIATQVLRIFQDDNKVISF